MSVHQEIKVENIAKLNELLKEIHEFIESLELQVRQDIHCFKQNVEIDEMTIIENQASK